MNLKEIWLFLLEIFTTYGWLVALIVLFIVIALVLGLKFADKFITTKAEKLGKSDISLIKHESMGKRKKSVTDVNRVITNMIESLDADKVALFELHNGGFNLTGLPFEKFDMVLVRNKFGVEEIPLDFVNVTVMSVPNFVDNLQDNIVYKIEDIEELKDIYPRLYRQLVTWEIKHAIFCRIVGIDEEIGFLMLGYGEHKEPTNKILMDKLFVKLLKLSTLLDIKK